MNLNIDIHNFSLVNINFLDTKKNIIMDGNFTKIIYSNQWFTINSIFIHFPIEWTSIDKIVNKYVLRFNPYSTKNIQVVQDFARLETRILEYFKTFFNLNVRIVNSFSKQLYTGNMKIFKEYTGDFSVRTKFSEDDPMCSSNITKTSPTCFVKPKLQNFHSPFPKDKSMEDLGFTAPLVSERSSQLAPFGCGVPVKPSKLSENDSSCSPNLSTKLVVKLEEPPSKCFVIKVSGIWENYEEIGLTFKLMEQGSTIPL